LPLRTPAADSPLRPPADGIPRFSVSELNGSIAALLERGFAPRFLVEATVSRPQRKKGHLWLTLTDGEASISAVVWASQLARLPFVPEEGDGVVVVGTLNFWTARANLCVQVLDVRPGLTAVLRQFERVRALLAPEGLLETERKRPLPTLPRRIALLTSVPSSALADMLRTARERWPATALLVVPIPVQGAVEDRIAAAVQSLSARAAALGLDALVLARGGGSREDLAVFDGADLARTLAACAVPVICGLGHEDDTTIADLVADYRAATPTAALVALLPDRRVVWQSLLQGRTHRRQILALRLHSLHQQLSRQRDRIAAQHPSRLLERERIWLAQQRRLLDALSPQHLLERGFSLVLDRGRRPVRLITQLAPGDPITIQLSDGCVEAEVRQLIATAPADGAPAQSSEDTAAMPRRRRSPP
jgi:exodeoxyribonuclease VII large subunit